MEEERGIVRLEMYLRGQVASRSRPIGNRELLEVS